MAAAVVVPAGFVAVERSRERRGVSPLSLAGPELLAGVGTVFFSIDGLVDAFETVLWIEAATLVIAAILVTLLPLRARADGTLPLDARAG